MNRQRTMQRLRAVLFEKQHRLLGEARARKGINDAFGRDGAADRADTAAVQSDLEIRCRLYERHWDELAEIETAIRKMHQGEYGLCEECGCRIAHKRLSVLPYAKFCLGCQEEHERRSEAGGHAGTCGDLAAWDEAEAMPDPFCLRASSPGR